jgi:DNA-binding CsgD family transcriptional regulator
MSAPNPMYLTPRERQVAALVASELTDKEIADRLQISIHGVDFHLRRLKRKFHAKSRVGVATGYVCVTRFPVASFPPAERDILKHEIQF